MCRVTCSKEICCNSFDCFGEVGSWPEAGLELGVRLCMHESASVNIKLSDHMFQ